MLLRYSSAMRTTLDLPDPLFKAVKTRAVQEGVTLKDLLATYIESGLRGRILEKKGGAKGRVLPVAIPRIPGTPLHPAMTNAELQAILGDDDIAQYKEVIARTPQAE